jgi:hypothetical protein
VSLWAFIRARWIWIFVWTAVWTILSCWVFPRCPFWVRWVANSAVWCWCAYQFGVCSGYHRCANEERRQRAELDRIMRGMLADHAKFTATIGAEMASIQQAVLGKPRELN